MISINNLSVQFTGNNLFDHVTFNINDRDRIGLVGKNGAGKSTLLRIIAGLQSPETGSIVIAKEQTVGYLPQEMIPSSNNTIIGEALSAYEQIDTLEKEFQLLTEEITRRTDYESEEYALLLSKHHEINEHILLLGGNNRQETAEKVLLGLGFKHTDFNRPIIEFSSGWQMRVELAKILLKRPDFVLLDEPTNHLDIESIQWLENFLISYIGTVILVSHDRTFLDAITKRTIEITAGKIYDYKASYSDYVVLMEERRSNQLSALSNQQKEVAQIQDFIERFRYKATKAKQVQSRVKMLERMDKIEIDEITTGSIHFQFPPAPHSGKIVIETEHLEKAYGKKQILHDITFTIPKGSKIAFVGRNGEGKSTLAKIIIGEITDYSGICKLGHQVNIGYFAQNQAALLDGEKTVFETIDQIAVGEIRSKIRNILGSFLFSNDDIDKKVKVLSGGEKARLALAKLLLTPCNLLVLDEPTNHLDMNSKDILKNALLQYSGTLIIVSHDRDFLQGLTDSLYEFKNKKIHEFKGDIFEFLESRKLENLKALETTKKESTEKNIPVSQNKLNYERSKEREREARKLRNTLECIETEIEKLETSIAEKDALLSNISEIGNSDIDFYSEYQKLKNLLETKMEEWEVATEAIETFLNEKENES